MLMNTHPWLTFGAIIAAFIIYLAYRKPLAKSFKQRWMRKKSPRSVA
jgi:hypothetical protein